MVPELLNLATNHAQILTKRRYYFQVDGVAICVWLGYDLAKVFDNKFEEHRHG